MRPGGNGRKVLVAMSGGVDSSVAAALLVRAGFEVVGVFMRLGSPGETVDRLEPADGASCDVRLGHRGCCSVSDAADARVVAAVLGIPLYVCNFRREFGRIVEHFADEYAAGRTPNPCVRCNDWLKFGRLHQYARQVGASCVASGHHARVGERAGWGGPVLMRAVDRGKDQSYVLFGAPRDRLGQMLLPVGWYPKEEVREMAHRMGLPVHNKPDSQEICFVPDDDYAGLVERVRPGVAREGDIRDSSGRVVGRHRGQHRFTVGQRRGVGVALGRPVYVTGKDAQTNTVTVGTREDALSDWCTAGEANWLTDAGRSAGWRPCVARHRYNGEGAQAQYMVLPDGAGPTPSGRTGRFVVRFAQPQFAVTPGQAVVLYDADEGEVVLGGGGLARAGRGGWDQSK